MRRLQDLVARTGLLAVALSLAPHLTAPASAGTLRLNFVGVADLSPSGGPSNVSFSGWAAWTEANPPRTNAPGVATFFLTSASLTLNGTDVSDQLRFDDATHLTVINDHGGRDQFQAFLALQTPFNPGGGQPITGVDVLLFGDPSLWSDTSLPLDLDLFAEMLGYAAFYGSQELSIGGGALTDLSVVHAPEPASLILVAGGLLLLIRQKIVKL